MELFKLFFGDCRWSGHDGGLAGFGDGKRYDFADVGLVGEEHYKTIQTWCDAGMGRRTVLIGMDEMAEAVFGFLRRQSHDLKYFSLDLWIRNPHAAGGKFKAIANEVVLLCTERLEIFALNKLFYVLGARRRKRIVS